MRSIVSEDNSNPLRYWIYTLIIITYCMNKRGFLALSFCRLSSSPTSILLSFSPLYFPGSLRIIFPLFLFPLQVSNSLPFAYLSLTSFSFTPLHYEAQLRITAPKIIYISLDSLTFLKVYITIYLLICLKHFHAARKHALDFLASWVPCEFRFFFVEFTWKLTRTVV